MATNATVTQNHTPRQTRLRRDGLRQRGITEKVLIITVLVLIVVLPFTWCISTAEVASLRVEVEHLRYRLSVYALPHLPLTTDSHLDTWEKHRVGSCSLSCLPVGLADLCTNSILMSEARSPKPQQRHMFLSIRDVVLLHYPY